MFINIQDTYNTIETDILTNAREVFYRYEYYTKKYRGNRLNDVNVGLFLNDEQIPTVQIFVRNKNGYMKSHIQFNKAGTKVNNIQHLNISINA